MEGAWILAFLLLGLAFGVPILISHRDWIDEHGPDQNDPPCTKCKWRRRSFVPPSYEFQKCRRPNLRVRPYTFCTIERRSWVALDACGPSGKYFEPKSKRQHRKWELAKALEPRDG